MSLYTHSGMTNIKSHTLPSHRKQGTGKTVQIINDQEVVDTLKTELLVSAAISTP